MTEPVVELLEIVDVDHQKRQGVPVPAGTLEFPAQRLVEFPMIIKPCQSIGYRHDLHAVVEGHHFEGKRRFRREVRNGDGVFPGHHLPVLDAPDDQEGGGRENFAPKTGGDRFAMDLRVPASR